MGKNIKKVMFCLIIGLIGWLIAVNCSGEVLRTHSVKNENVLYIDAGHGGIDGGAVSSDGVPEKDINLSIARKVRELAKASGWQVVMTRETDEGLYKEGGSIRAKKTEDLRQRCALLKKYRPTVAVSIHLNSFKEDTSVKGVQVFYPGGWDDADLNEKSKEFAGIMQTQLIEKTEAEKKRTPLEKDGVLLFKEEVCPIIIVECGFLSNPKESELLQKTEYQRLLAEGIMAGITEFTGVERKPEIEVIDSLSKKNKD